MNEDKKNKFNWPLIGNSHIVDFLSKGIINNNIANSYIFLGPDDLGKTTVANHFAKILLCQNLENNEHNTPCNKCQSCLMFKDKKDTEADLSSAHGDFYLVKKEKDKKNITIEQIREFIKNLSMSSFLNNYKIGIIKRAERLSLEASNALLKTLEEPREKVAIILIASSSESLPKTILSRSQVLNFLPVKTDVIYEYLMNNYKASRSQALNLSRLCLGRPALALKFFEDKTFLENYLERARVFLKFFNNDINERFEGVESLIGSGLAGQESINLASRIIDTWRGLARDLLLLDMGQNDLIQHQAINEELNKNKNYIKKENVINIIKSLDIAEGYLKSNVNPKLVLENIAINI